MKKLILNKSNKIGLLKIIKEQPYCEIKSIKVNSIGIDNTTETQTIFSNITLTVISKNEKGSTNQSIIALSTYNAPTLIEPAINISFLIKDCHKYDQFELVYNNSHPDDLEIEIYYDNKNHNIPLDNPFVKFKEHIEQNDNIKILFSAPFGQGKTTFIKHFFEKNKEYNIFNLFPVNYSISHNEDIFKYIKAEIFVKLLNISTFDKITFSKIESAYFFLNSNKHLLIPLVKLLPQIGESAFELAKLITDFETKFKEYIKYLNIDDAKKANHYIEELGIKEGSIFEDNFYTKLIREQLYKLKAETKLKNVLIIDDLDRMDPDHIFRILNVFAAHFDCEHNSEYSNKFGFDKIILVGDYNNLKNIFEYKYGPKVEFNGYINKYYSKAPFIYDNKKAIAAIINDINKGTRLYDSEFYSLDILSLILKDLVDINELTLRSLIKLNKENAPKKLLNKNYKSNNQLKNEYGLFIFFNIIQYLNLTFDLDTLLNKLEICKKLTTNQDNQNYQKYTELGLPSLVDNKKGYLEECDFNESIKIDKTELLLSFKIVRGSNIRNEYQYYEVDKLKKKINISDSMGESITFSKSDFYTILILNLHKYISVGGFE